ncbi:MAG: hypothetical protein ACK56I_07085, partial [bacterium]
PLQRSPQRGNTSEQHLKEGVATNKKLMHRLAGVYGGANGAKPTTRTQRVPRLIGIFIPLLHATHRLLLVGGDSLPESAASSSSPTHSPSFMYSSSTHRFAPRPQRRTIRRVRVDPAVERTARGQQTPVSTLVAFGLRQGWSPASLLLPMVAYPPVA